MRPAHLLSLGMLVFIACDRNAPAEDHRIAPVEAPAPPVWATSDVNEFGKEFAHALELNDTLTLISHLDTSVTWGEMAAVLGTIEHAKGSTDSVRVARTQTSFTMVNGKSKTTWKIFLTAYHEKGTTDQSVVVHLKAGKPWVVGYHVER